MAVVGTCRALIDADGDLRTAHYISGAAEQRVVVASDGRLAAHIYHISRPPHIVIEFGFTLHPDRWGTSLGDTLLEGLMDNADRLVQLAPGNARVVMQATVLADDDVARALLAGHGFQVAREWVHFELELDQAPVVEVPDGVTIRQMDPRADWPAVGAAMDEAFSDHWGELGPQLRTLLEEDEADEDGEKSETGDEEPEDDPYSNSLGLCFVAEMGGKVIGSCLCNARTIEWPDSGKLGSLSVRRAHRRSGVGHVLTAVALAEFHRRGIRRIITDTDNASFTGANRLYPRFGFRPYRYELVYEKELRPGQEWRALITTDLA